jgi:hypothetical protein
MMHIRARSFDRTMSLLLMYHSMVNEVGALKLDGGARIIKARIVLEQIISGKFG